MPWQSIKLIPGLNVEKTPSLNEAGYSSTNLIRWRNGLAEKVGGWTKYFNGVFPSISRELHAWRSLNNVVYLANGTDTSLEVISSGVDTVLTPQIYTSNIAPSFTTTLSDATVTITDANISTVTTYDAIYLNTPVIVGGLVLFGQYAITGVGTHTLTIEASSVATSGVTNGGAVPTFTTVSGTALVTVTITGHGLVAGSTLAFPIATSVGGLSIYGNYTVASVADANNFVITASSAATSSVGPTSMNSGLAQILYYIGIGPSSVGGGWGVGAYGMGGYGVGVASSVQTGTAITATDWTLTNWGELLVACPKGGAIYWWGPATGYQTMMPVSTAPFINDGIFLAMPQQILVSWGTVSDLDLGSIQDPMLIKWCDTGDFFTWTPAVSNLAGNYRIPRGSRIVGGFQTSIGAMIWTDIEAWSMDYVNYPDVWHFNKLAGNCGLIARGAVAELGSTVYWMASTNIFMRSGNGVQALPCPVWDAVFQDLDTANVHKIRGFSNTSFNEIGFYYPSLSGGTGENDKYVKCNPMENAWDTGTLARSSWLDVSVAGNPIGGSPSTKIIYQHETSPDADGVPITPSFTTGLFSLAEGEEFTFVDLVTPDMKFGAYGQTPSAVLEYTFYGYDNVGDTPITYGPFTITSATQIIEPRMRHRYLSYSVTSSDIGSFWRQGRPRFRFAPDGRR
jgi:hypothetical protein